MIGILKEKYGQQCLGLKVNYLVKEDRFPFPEMPLRFCEAVKRAFEEPLLITPKDLKCLGSKRSLGLTLDEVELIENIHHESGIERNFIRKAVSDIPKLEKPIENILLGIDESMEKEIRPDIFIIYIQPFQVMEFIKDCALKLSKIPVIKPYTFMSVCGNVFINTYKNRNLSISFGCPDSRKYAGLTENLLVAGIPYHS